MNAAMTCRFFSTNGRIPVKALQLLSEAKKLLISMVAKLIFMMASGVLLPMVVASG